MRNSTTPKEIQMTEDEVRALLEKIELEKKFPSFTELRKRVIETLPRLLDRPCPELVRLIPSFPHHVNSMPEIEEVATRLINGGTTVISSEGKAVSLNVHRLKWPLIGDNFYEVAKMQPNARAINSLLTDTLSIWQPLGAFGEFDHLRAKVLEALPVLVGWLAAHQIMVAIPVVPFSSEHVDRM
jgi:hypothetical protein